jgi:hypothetical protein
MASATFAEVDGEEPLAAEAAIFAARLSAALNEESLYRQS